MAPRTGLVFYGGYALIDSFLLLMAGTIAWQVTHLKRWVCRRRQAAWIGIAFNLLVLAGILILPSLVGTDWVFLLNHRPEIGIAFLAIGLLLAAIAVFKIFHIVRSK